MDAGRALGQQLGRLGGGVGDAELGDRARIVLAAPRARAAARSGMRAPQSAVSRSIWAMLVIGMIPGSTGTSMPPARRRSTKRR